ncbi:MAG: LysE family transporter [Oscillospiraceae bacterium]
MNFAAFFSYVFLTTFTPGPNNIMSMSLARKYGFKTALRFAVGVFFGLLIIMTLSAAFSSLLYRCMPKVEPVMLVIGAAYILWLAWAVWRDKPHGNSRGLAEANIIISGILLQFLNVKGILYGLTVMSSFILPYYRSFAAISLFILLIAVICIVSVLCWALFGTAFERLFQRHGKILNAAMALLLVYCAVTMLLEL